MRPAPSRPAHDHDPDATLQALYSDHGPALRAYVTRLLCDPHQAEDVVQETMLRAWQRFGHRLAAPRGRSAP